MQPSSSHKSQPHQPQVAEQDRPDPACGEPVELNGSETQRFRTFMKRNLNQPPPPVPDDLLDLIYAAVDRIDAEE